VKYLKIAHSGEELDLDRVNLYKQKGVRHLYLTKKDFIAYMKFNLNLSQYIRSSKKVDHERKINLMKHTSELILERIHSSGINQDSFEDAKLAIETTLEFLAESPQSFDLIDALNQHSDSLYAHSLGVSIYSVMIGKKLGWNSGPSTYKLSMGGLLHDVGKKEISKDILNKSRASISSDEIKILESHPFRGVEILSAISTIPSDILQIVHHHHEREGGAGYPNRLMKLKIHPLARVVAVADEFCNLVIGEENSERISPALAVNRIESIYHQYLDSTVISALKSLVIGQ
jgi:HD-GYP domain-containing protein (c-di-GMP phosphodiesterase class II)